jgi:hypothetical protein
MASVDLLDDHLVVRSDGLGRLLTVVSGPGVRYEAIDDVAVGLDALPPWYIWRLGYNPGLGTRRAGVFWWRAGNGSWTSTTRLGRWCST